MKTYEEHLRDCMLKPPARCSDCVFCNLGGSGIKFHCWLFNKSSTYYARDACSSVDFQIKLLEVL